jgi:murein DD-endopeptidase MepM/ murein hydrolase activator NlpD
VALVAAAAVAVVVGVMGSPSDKEEDAPVKVERPSPTPVSSPSNPRSSTTPAATPTSTPPAVVRGFRFPIEGACIPAEDDLIPNAPREYRFGVHEGVDFYPGRACATIERGTPVLAAKTGIVIRADVDYKDITQEEMDGLLSRSAQEGTTPPEVLDRLRGRQVWIDHGDGVVTRYCHLLSIEPGVAEGMAVEVGQVIARVGNSGTPEGVTDPNVENHLHFEIRVGDKFLGQGLSVAETRRLLEVAFSP